MRKLRLTYKHTIAACYIGYLAQALVINFPPLLFLTFERTFELDLSRLSALIAVSFLTQLTVNLLASLFLERLNQRASAVFGQLCAVAGMVGYGTLPFLLTSPFAGIVIATVLCSIGGGLTEVILSPLLEACPTDEKSGAMSLLHSFYCWGQVATILLSTLFFATVGLEHWRLLAILWTALPLLGTIAFAVVPFYRLDADAGEESEKPTAHPLRNRLFLLFFLLMICAGAAEQIMSQWASTFAEAALGVEKTVGDLLGPCMFALLMGISRAFYGKNSAKLHLSRFMFLSCLLCMVSYLVAALSPVSWLSLVGCALCGLSVGIFWPGTYSRAANDLRGGGIMMFALLALGGDLGCLVGPSVAGQIAAWCGGELRYAFLFALIFPVVGILCYARVFKKK